jgi:hypothetical protein
MNTNKPFVLPERNPLTHARHKHDVLLQITLPLVIGGLLIVLAIAGIIWSAAGGPASGEVNRWANVSLIWLILPALFFVLLGTVILIGLVYAVTKLLAVLPGYARLTQDWFVRLGGKVRLVSDKVVEPFLKAHSFSAGTRQAGRSVRNQVDEILNQ